METQQDRVIGKARGYRELINVFRAFFEEKHITRLALDEQCGLAEGYSAKLLALPPIRHLGEASLTLMLGRFDLELWLVHKPRSDASPDTSHVKE